MVTISHTIKGEARMNTVVKPLFGHKGKLVLKLKCRFVDPSDYYFDMWETQGAECVVQHILGDREHFQKYFAGYEFPRGWLFDLVDGSPVVITKTFH